MTRLERFTRRFFYEPDRGLEALRWRVLDEGDPRGDCEDFALTAAWIMARGSWLRFWLDQITGRSVVWVGRLSGGSFHAALCYRGVWIDNTVAEWQPEAPMRKLVPMWGPLLVPLIAPWWLKAVLLGAAAWASWPG